MILNDIDLSRMCYTYFQNNEKITDYSRSLKAIKFSGSLELNQKLFQQEIELYRVSIKFVLSLIFQFKIIKNCEICVRSGAIFLKRLRELFPQKKCILEGS